MARTHCRNTGNHGDHARVGFHHLTFTSAVPPTNNKLAFHLPPHSTQSSCASRYPISRRIILVAIATQIGLLKHATRCVAPPVALPEKRGRAAKIYTVEVAVETTKKRGRLAKAKAEESVPVVEDAPKPKKRGCPSNNVPEPVIEAPMTKKGRGRPNKEAAPVGEVPVPRNRGGRPRKEEAIAVKTAVTHMRGRPARTTAFDLNRVAGSPHVGK
jgi:hypothetical protein